MTILTALFTALMAAGAFIRIPMVPVPVTLQTLFVYLAALLLPPFHAFAAMALYAFLGTIGLPIFTSGGGLSALLGPTGGFIFAFLLAAPAGAWIAKKGKGCVSARVLAVIAVAVLYYLSGIIWLRWKLDTTLAKAIAVGMLPFLPGDALKMAAAVAAAGKLEGEIERFMEKQDREEKEE